LTIVKTGFKSIFLEFFIVLHQSSKCVALLALYLNRKKVYTANGVVYHSESIEWVVGVKSEVLDKFFAPILANFSGEKLFPISLVPISLFRAVFSHILLPKLSLLATC